MTDAARFGEQLGDFLRGLLRTPSPSAQQAPKAAPARKWAVVDANEVRTGAMVSLDLELEPGEAPGQLTRDVEAFGIAHFSTGETCFLNVVVAKDYANAISLIPAAPLSPAALPPGSPSPNTPPAGPVGLEEGKRSGTHAEEVPPRWNLVADGDRQPFGSQPYEVTFFERSVAGTDVIRIGGQIFDPKSQNRVNFSVTHDPVETITLAS